MLFDSGNESCPLHLPSNPTPLAKAAVFYSCSLHDDESIPAEPTSAALPTLQEMVQQERAIPEMTTPGDAGLTAIVAVGSLSVTSQIINVLNKIDRVGTVISEVSRIEYFL